jgi:4-amino-4-deoxy-L-arabinose transferase-like glycosyltransferase
MKERKHELKQNLKKNVFTRYSIILVIIIGISCLIRFYYFPFNVPLNSDALYYFWYSSDIIQIGKLPSEWSPVNNGWPIFVSLFFSIFGDKDILTLMSIQRFLSVIISVLILIPVYFLCKKFVERKFALIGTTLIAVDPRLMINSFLGTTDPLYLLLIVSSLTLFLYSNKKFVYFSFVIVGLATLVRGEGIMFFVVLSIMFFIKYRNEKYKVFLKYCLVLLIFTIILLPLTMYRIDSMGSDGMLMRSIEGATLLMGIEDEQNISNNKLISGLEVLIKYLIWIMIPNFILFIPLGIFLIFKEMNFNKLIIIISTGMMIIPAVYAYTVPALDTRYLYVLFPMFSVLSVLSIEKMVSKFNKNNVLIIIIIIILSIIISSSIFYEQQKIDHNHEKGSFEVMKKIFPLIKGTNILYPETSYFSTVQTINQWPNLYSKMKFDMTIISTDNYTLMEKFVFDSKELGLTHIIVDNNMNREKFLNELFFDETKYSYLKKVYDSKNDGYVYHVKVFEIDYESLNKEMQVLTIYE